MKIAVFGNMDIEADSGVEVRRFEITSFYPNEKIDGLYYRIFVSNCIPELPREAVMDFLKKAHDALEVNGEIIVQVPMAEFAAKQLFTNKADPITYYMLYGTDEHPFRACYTMLQMRTLLARAKFNVKEATEAILKLTTTDGEELNLPVHSLVAVRND